MGKTKKKFKTLPEIVAAHQDKLDIVAVQATISVSYHRYFVVLFRFNLRMTLLLGEQQLADHLDRREHRLEQRPTWKLTVIKHASSALPNLTSIRENAGQRGVEAG